MDNWGVGKYFNNDGFEDVTRETTERHLFIKAGSYFMPLCCSTRLNNRKPVIYKGIAYNEEIPKCAECERINKIPADER